MELTNTEKSFLRNLRGLLAEYNVKIVIGTHALSDAPVLEVWSDGQQEPITFRDNTLNKKTLAGI